MQRLRRSPEIFAGPAAALVVAFLAVSAAHGQANPPVKSGAAAVKLALVTSYAPCTVPDVTHNGGPACTPVRLDTVCGFGSNGRGSYRLKKRQNAAPTMAAWVKLTGLDPACEGLELCQETVVRTTQADDFNCTGATGCTIADPPPTGHCCTVANGTCHIKDSGIHSNVGNVVEAELFSCWVRRTTGPALPTKTFSCGFFTDLTQ